MYKYDAKDGFKNLVKNIKKYFASSDVIMHEARNKLKIINYNNTKLVVKSFKIPNIINRIIYAYIRDGKAKKSFFNGIKLTKLNVVTPQPIGYIEFYKYGLLQKSFAISVFQPYDFLIREPLYNDKFLARITIIKCFVNFTYQLHQQNIYHKDYSAGNILVFKNNNTYSFSVVDINRIQFKKINLYLAMKNFNKLWANSNTLTIIAKEYAKISNYNEKKCLKIILAEDKKLKTFVENRRKWKKNILGK